MSPTISTRCRAALLALVTLLPAGAALTAQTVDQKNQHPNLSVALEPSTDWNLQAFIPTSHTSAGAALKLIDFSPASPNGNLRMELWTGIPGDVNSVKLATGESTVSFVPGNGSAYVDVFWAALVAVNPGTPYFLTAKAFGPSLQLQVAGTTSGGYDNGYAYHQSQAVTTPLSGWSGTPGWDLDFKEYSTGPETGPTDPITTTPEPAALLLLGTGLVAVGVLRRRITR